MMPIRSFLEKYGIHSLLLPVFFIIHGYKQYYGLVEIGVAVKVLGKLLLFFIIFFFLVLTITKNANKSLQLTTLFGFVYLFYGVIKDFFQFTLHAPFLAKYSVLLPVLIIISTILARVILKKKDFRTANLFQNLLLIIFIAIDAFGIIASNNSFLLERNLLTEKGPRELERLPPPASKPDVYYIVLDCYPGTRFLKNYMQYDNSPFDEALKEKGFHVLAEPKSNYNWTAFSIGSTLNFEYFRGVKNFSHVGSMLYNQALLTTKKSVVPQFFRKNGYEIYNLSIFDIGNTPSILRETFLTIPEENVLLYNSFWERTMKDLSWNLITGKYSMPFFKKIYERRREKLATARKEKRDFNNTVIDSLLKIPSQS